MKKYNLADFKDVQGLWVKSYRTSDGQFWTRAGGLWQNINKRCGSHKDYENSSNDFISFQLFVEWCMDEYGYLKKDESGRFWAIDKDILIHKNKSYNKEACLFVPTSVNSLFTWKTNNNGLPVGVCKLPSGNYGARIRNDSKDFYLGTFSTPIDAHREWQLNKVQNIMNHRSDDLGEKLNKALENNAKRIFKQIENGEETV